jgi:hypothetical protein
MANLALGTTGLPPKQVKLNDLRHFIEYSLDGRPTPCPPLFRSDDNLTPRLVSLRNFNRQLNSATALRDILDMPQMIHSIDKALQKVLIHMDYLAAHGSTFSGRYDYPYEDLCEVILRFARPGRSRDEETVCVRALDCLWHIGDFELNFPVDRICSDDFVQFLLSFSEDGDALRPAILSVVSALMCHSPEMSDFFTAHDFFDVLEGHLPFPFAATALKRCCFGVSADSAPRAVALLNGLFDVTDQFLHKEALKAFAVLLHRFGTAVIDISAPIPHLVDFLSHRDDNGRVNSTLVLCRLLPEAPPVFEQLLQLMTDVEDCQTHALTALVLARFAAVWRDATPPEMLRAALHWAESEPFDSAEKCMQVVALYGRWGDDADFDSRALDLFAKYLGDGAVGMPCLPAVFDIVAAWAAADDGLKLIRETLYEMLPVVFEMRGKPETNPLVIAWCNSFIKLVGTYIRGDAFAGD